MSVQLALVTGGGRGLGLAIVERLLKDGYRVVAASRKPSDQFMALQRDWADALFFERLDLGETGTLYGFVRRILDNYGVPCALVNNAAVAHDGVLATMHESQIEETITTNVTGTLILTKYVARAMMRQRIGAIVNVASVVASTGYSGLSVYAASKAAMIGFTRSLARELGRIGITVNAIAPGYMETDMTAGMGETQLEMIRRRSALRRLPEVGEVADSVAFLLGPGGRSITGTILTVDAGNTA